MVALAKVAAAMSVDEFLAWDSDDGRLWQFVDGVPQAMTPPSLTHGTLQGELSG